MSRHFNKNVPTFKLNCLDIFYFIEPHKYAHKNIKHTRGFELQALFYNFDTDKS